MLELGDQEVQFHYEVGKLIDPAKISYVFTYGKLGAQIAEGAKINFPNERVKAYDNKEELVKRVASSSRCKRCCINKSISRYEIGRSNYDVEIIGVYK